MLKLLPKIFNKRFMILWLLVFLLLFLILYTLGFVPAGILEIGDGLHSFSNKNSALLSEAAVSNQLSDNPFGESRLIIGDIGLDALIVHPESTDIKTLNDAITKGVAQYPGSGQLGEVGNVFLFGHSSTLKIVNNQNYAIFNRLKELKMGALIHIESNGNEYWYIVKSVLMKKANAVQINFATSKKLLTISTCNVFGAKEDRYVVEAEFVKSYPLAK